MSPRRLSTVVALALSLAGIAACHRGTDPAIVQLNESRRLVTEIRVQLAKASGASDRSVMADTDEESIKYAREAEAATQAVGAALPLLGAHLAGLGQAGNTDLLARFQEQFGKYQTLDKQILALAVENTNLKAQRLSFGPIRRAADDFCDAVQDLIMGTPAAERCRNGDVAARAQLAIREIEILQAPHIAEAQDAEMDRLEKEMATRQTVARDALRQLGASARAPAQAVLERGKTALDKFDALSRELIGLSRRNSNVRSLELALRQKPALLGACDESLGALQQALAQETLGGTR